MANLKGHFATLTPMKPQGKKAKLGSIAIRVEKEKEESLRVIPSWQDRLRAAIDKLIEEGEKEKECQQENIEEGDVNLEERPVHEKAWGLKVFEDQVCLVDSICQERGISKSDFFRELLDRYIEEGDRHQQSTNAAA